VPFKMRIASNRKKNMTHLKTLLTATAILAATVGTATAQQYNYRLQQELFEAQVQRDADRLGLVPANRGAWRYPGNEPGPWSYPAPTPTRAPAAVPSPHQATAPQQIAVKVYELSDSLWYTPDKSPECQRDEEQCKSIRHNGRQTVDDFCAPSFRVGDPVNNDWCDASWVSTKNTNLTKDTLQFDVTCTAYDRAGRVLGTGRSDMAQGNDKILPPAGSDKRSFGQRSIIRLYQVKYDEVARTECHAENVSRISDDATANFPTTSGCIAHFGPGPKCTVLNASEPTDLPQAPAPQPQTTAPTVPPTLPAANLSPLSVRLAEINLLAKQSLLTVARHCGSDVACRKQQTAALQEIVSKERTIAKALRNPTTYKTTVPENDSVNVCLVAWRASEDYASTLQCINDAAQTK
jgi:hypothetical protein